MTSTRLFVATMLVCGCAGAPPPADGASTAATGTAEAAAAGSGAPASGASAAPSGSPQSGELIGVPIAEKTQGGGGGSQEAGGGAQSVELVFVESKTPKGQTKKLLFDVTLRNARTEPRWFVLPAVVHPQDKMIKSGVDGVELWSLKGNAKVIVGH